METTLERPANHLADETSPYLLQHARNPVDWYPWGPEALAKAAVEDKPILVSIGYSSCHWCHVMERESFEDEDVARVMNERFVCIKVDREERPDLDQIYMTAVQLITRQGGWPLNCFALPDGRPIHGGTYFPRAQWIRTLIELSDFYRRSPDEAHEFAERLAQGVRETSLVAAAPEDTEFSFDTLIATVEPWKSRLDWKLGGELREQNKFPMPDNWRFLGRYALARGDARLEAAWETTLDRIAHGGIYDQVGGGFARYSTDKYWIVPHFEKMLYDNAQLVGLYSEAWRRRGKPAWRRVVEETLEFVRREMTTPEGAFCSALDADSEGEEGRFYVWTRRELVETLGDLEPVASAAWSATDQGNWEDGKNVLNWVDDEEAVARRLGIQPAELEAKLRAAKEKLLARRAARVRPGLDDKVLTSWNALMSKGYLEAYDAFGDPGHLEAAARNLDFLLRELRREGRLLHAWRGGNGHVPAFLEDYAALADALVALYEATFDGLRLDQARDLVEEAIALFHDPETGLFYLSREKDLIVRQMEIHDNVIPSSNSILARTLLRLSIHLGEPRYAAMAVRALRNVVATMPQYGSAFSSWGMLLLDLVRPPMEIAILGPDALAFRAELARRAPPGSVLAGSVVPGGLPLLRDRFPASGTAIHVCRDRACLPPVAAVEQALALLG